MHKSSLSECGFMKLRIPQNINASTKDNQAFSQNNGRLESTQYLLQQISSQLFMTHDLFLHSQFPRNWSVLFDTDHGQAWLFIPEFRQGSEDTVSFSFFFFIGRVFAFLFKTCHSTQKGPNRAILYYSCLIFSFLVIFATVHAVPPLLSSSSYC